MTVRPLKVHLGADELRQVIMSSILGAFNQQAKFTTVQTLPLITLACGYVRRQIERRARCVQGVLRSGRMDRYSGCFSSQLPVPLHMHVRDYRDSLFF